MASSSRLCLRSLHRVNTLARSRCYATDKSQGGSLTTKDQDIEQRVAEYDKSFLVDQKPTHTGQIFEPDDYRMARFIDKQEKKVNPRFAIDLINEVPPIPCKGRVVHCDGGDGPLGHPRVFINLDKPGNHACNYCGLRFYQEGHHHH